MLDFIFSRRSIRKYTGETVDDETVKQILSAGMSAPSAVNSRPWEFIVVSDRGLLKKLNDTGTYWKMLEHADKAIVPLCDARRYPRDAAIFAPQDMGACAQNILLAANALGVGAVWLGLYPRKELIDAVREILSIPAHLDPYMVISLGMPGERKEPYGKYDEGRVHFNKY